MCQLPPTKHADTCCISRCCFWQAFPALHWKAGSAFGWPDNRFTVGTSVISVISVTSMAFVLFSCSATWMSCFISWFKHATTRLTHYTPPGPLLRLDNGSGILLRKMCWLQLKTDNLIKYVKMPSMHSDAMLVTVQDESFQTFGR